MTDQPRPTITWDDFTCVDLRVGTVVEAQVNPEAHKPAYILQVDFSPHLGVRKSSARITDLYSPQDLVGRQVIAVVNVPPRQIGTMMSQALITGFADEQGCIVLAQPQRPVPDGSRLI
jgi:tRNA-binding protein